MILFINLKKGMYSAMYEHIKCCDFCQRNRRVENVEHPLVFPEVKKPFEHVQVDFFQMPEDPKTKDKYVLTIQDYFTKYTWGFKFQTKESTNYANSIFKLITENKFPIEKIHHDNGGEFIAEARIYLN
jgi:IS30 family transposase